MECGARVLRPEITLKFIQCLTFNTSPSKDCQIMSAKPIQLARWVRLWPADKSESRRASWLELFFDLIFVAAVSQVGVPLGQDYSIYGLVRYSLMFLLIWWAWFGHTMYSTRFDADDVVHRLLTLVQIFAAALLAFPSSRSWGVALAAPIVFGWTILLLDHRQYLGALGLSFALTALAVVMVGSPSAPSQIHYSVTRS